MISSFHSDPIRILPYNPFEPLWDRSFDVFDRELNEPPRRMKTLIPDRCCSGGSFRRDFEESIIYVSVCPLTSLWREQIVRLLFRHAIDHLIGCRLLSR